MKICNRCGESKPLEEFDKTTRTDDGRRNPCKACRASAYRARYLAKHGELKKKRWTPEEDALLSKLPPSEVSARTGRSLYAIHVRKSKLGITDLDYPRACSDCGCGFVSKKPRTLCRECSKTRQRNHVRDYQRRKSLEPGHRERSNQRDLLRYWERTFGLTEEDYLLMLASQGGCCAICQTEDPGGLGNYFRVDHDHQSGAVRGLLCNRCNLGIGQLNDDPVVLQAAVDYLRRSRLRRVV